MTSSAPQDRWLFGPKSDMLLGCGVGYALVLVGLALVGEANRLLIPIAAAGPILLLVSGIPHYGATLLRVYESRNERRAYAFFTVWCTLALAALFVASFRWFAVGSFLLTLYLTWSPWHYSGQNYGLAVMFLRRRQVDVDPLTKRVLYLTFFLSFLLTVFSVHGVANVGATYAPLSEDPAVAGFQAVYRFVAVPIPALIQASLLTVGFVAYGASLVAALVRLRARASWNDLLPALALIVTQAIWFAAPVALLAMQALGRPIPATLSLAQNGILLFLWVAIGHSVQYLWVTAYYARRSSDFPGVAPYFAKCLMAGAAIWAVPSLLFAPAVSGVTFASGLGFLIAAVVNLHHFILDGAIWKLRDGKVANILISKSAGAEGPQDEAHRAWLKPILLSVGFVCIFVQFFGTWDSEVSFKRSLARGDYVGARDATERLKWIARDEAMYRYDLGVIAGSKKRWDEADRQLTRSLELRQVAHTYYQRASVRERKREVDAALADYDSGFSLDPSPWGAYWYATALMKAGQEERAREIARSALAEAEAMEKGPPLHEILGDGA